MNGPALVAVYFTYLEYVDLTLPFVNMSNIPGAAQDNTPLAPLLSIFRMAQWTSHHKAQ
jgi:hypothetical protein